MKRNSKTSGGWWRMRTLPAILCILIGASIGSGGCKTIVKPDSLPDWVPSELPDDPKESPDAVDITKIKWKGDNYSQAQVDDQALIRSASLDQHEIHYDMSIPAGWPRKIVKVEVQAIAVFGYEQNGKIIMGKYDWIRTGGQAVKLTENIHDGYNGLSMPITGTPCYTMLVSVNGRFRTSIKQLTWR